MWKYIFSIAILVCVQAQAQDASNFVEEILEMDTLPKYRMRSVQIGANLMRLGENLLDKPRTSGEFQVELGVHKFFLVADLGAVKTSRGEYSMEGNYWRVGVDANMSAAWDEGQMIGLGVRIAGAKFSDQATITRTIADGLDQTILLSNSDLQTTWAELVFTVKGELSKNLYTGYTMRYQVFQNYKSYPAELRPFDIPGYGKTTLANSVQFDYYIGWKFKFD